MEDLIKKFIYTGVGLVSMTTDKFRQTIDQLVSDEKLSREEGKEIVDKFFQSTETRKEEFEQQLNQVIERVIAQFNFAPRSEIEKLEARIKELEAEQSK
ncbi:MAG: phasin family protein [Bernardetiaceae bacterium]